MTWQLICFSSMTYVKATERTSNIHLWNMYNTAFWQFVTGRICIPRQYWEDFTYKAAQHLEILTPDTTITTVHKFWRLWSRSSANKVVFLLVHKQSLSLCLNTYCHDFILSCHIWLWGTQPWRNQYQILHLHSDTHTSSLPVIST